MTSKSKEPVSLWWHRSSRFRAVPGPGGASSLELFPDIKLVNNGWHLAYISVPNLFGSPKAIARWEKLHEVMV